MTEEALAPESQQGRPLAIRGAEVLLPGEGLTEATVVVADGRIAECTSGPGGDARAIDARGLLLLPGIIDLHGDAFEHFLMPRSGVPFPAAVALAEVDRQLVANGITTAYHGITYSWEPGLRGRETVLAVLDALNRLNGVLGCDTRIHLRHELYNVDAETEILEWIRAGQIGLIALNDHLSMIRERLGRAEKLSQYTERSGLSPDAYRTLVEDIAARADEVAPATARLCAQARAAGVPIASHDDESPAMRAAYRELGVQLCEFPCNAETAADAIAAGEPVILGAPNVLRGGSHDGRLHAGDAINEGLCTVLASDYYYPATLHAACQLWSDGGMELARAWDLVAGGPARAAGLTDRGMIHPSLRADLVLVDPNGALGPAVAATIAGGRVVHAHRGLGDQRHPVLP
ncbi:alpha-D-ribose 1-methylphosphonate 5-triphosphate diphosphatase [Sediminicurvatus halobius]|uniref:Alpha-D-ribose 1-methylphosphonate 5-triphosphate diphosphatase n=1 Tax=Sediminicurvatus halobius TaxID=2182432 RepID=A0A2U2MWK8_9GAMM|nr:alpha-D-ribose 1-methylphosphonate 5-triphosphate diphosphatase [Spiribacter halobius]PWG61202.1 alpha-D-ribose 1-methylphosphonate 5-triphosphate diphosphatase [Spiribacter halobius]UEX77940.1 alpha-D-ribose 1-methylphosphonate 5-triphosphate diphosphatase [Spiribacter halobius]